MKTAGEGGHLFKGDCFVVKKIIMYELLFLMLVMLLFLATHAVGLRTETASGNAVSARISGLLLCLACFVAPLGPFGTSTGLRGESI